MYKKMFVLCLTASLCISLFGCAKMPKLTEDEEELVAEYAAALLLKYDSENHSRLVDIKDKVSAFEDAKALHDLQEENYYNNLNAEEQKRLEETREQEEANKEYANNTTVVDKTSPESDYNSNTHITVDNVPVGEFLGLSGVSIDYAGADVLSEYPDSEDVVSVTMLPKAGNSLLIVYFNVSNNTDSNRTVNIAGIAPSALLNVNGAGFKRAETTILEDDLLTCNEEFAPNRMKRFVMVTEVRTGTVVTGLELKLIHNEETLVKSLR